MAALLFLCPYSCAASQVDSQQIQVSGYESKNPQSETYNGFVEAFKKAHSNNFAEKDLNEIFRDYSNLIMTGMDTSQLANAIRGRKTSYFPLEKLRTEPFYTPTIKDYINSANQYQRVLAYITLASAGDNSFNTQLLKASKAETFKGGKYWAGFALLYLRDTHTSDLFDFLVENEEFGDAHMAPFYLRLDKDSIRTTAYEKIRSNKSKAKILAVQSLSVTELNPKTEEVVREAVKSWEPSMRGYAIYTIVALSMGNLKELLLPSLNFKETRAISLKALANSPTQSDQQYLESLIPANGEIPEDILDAYLESNRKASALRWLQLVRDRMVSPNYYFSLYDKPLLLSDGVLDELRKTIRETKNREIVHQFLRALENRNDDDSNNLLIQLLTDPDSTTRYWAAFSLKGKSSALLVHKIPNLIKNPVLRTVALTDLAIENKVDGLQDVYEGVLRNDPSQDWYRSSLSYLAAFPRQKDISTFKAVLQSSKDAFLRRFAVSGLGNLRDESSVDLIVAALKKEPPIDQNAITYLVALGKIKGDKAKLVIESYQNSKDNSVRNLVSGLLTKW